MDSGMLSIRIVLLESRDDGMRKERVLRELKVF